MENKKNLQKVPNSTLKNKVCSEPFSQSRFLGSSKLLHSSPFSKMESSGFDDKKIFLLLIIGIFLLSLILIPTISSQATSSTPTGLPQTSTGGEIDPASGLPTEVLPIAKAGDIISDSDKRTAYLKAEWEKILLKSETFGPAVRFLKRLDPVSNFILGLPITFSWYFFLTLVIFIGFIVVIFRVTSLFEIANKWIYLAVALLICLAISYYRYPKIIATSIVGWIVIFNQWWMQYVIIAIVILAIILATYFSKQVEIVWKAIKEKSKKSADEFKKDFELEKIKRNNELIDNLRDGLSK